jgi:hypothetical protein
MWELIGRMIVAAVIVILGMGTMGGVALIDSRMLDEANEGIDVFG